MTVNQLLSDLFGHLHKYEADTDYHIDLEHCYCQIRYYECDYR